MGTYRLWRRVADAIASSCANKRRGRARAAPTKALFLTCALLAASVPQAAQARLQCVPFARAQSGIAIFGNAWTWWSQAEGVYARGSTPQVGAVLAMAQSSATPIGHVAVVKKIVDARHILLDHANWSSPGMIERGVLAEDVSPQGDWSAVKVWYGPIRALGSRVNPVSGFIYPHSAPPKIELAAQSVETSRSVSEAFDSALSKMAQAG